MKENPLSVPATAEFHALSMLVSAYLAMLEPRHRDAFAMSLLRTVHGVEAEPITTDEVEQAVSWVRGLVAQIARPPKVA